MKIQDYHEPLPLEKVPRGTLVFFETKNGRKYLIVTNSLNGPERSIGCVDPFNGDFRHYPPDEQVCVCADAVIEPDGRHPVERAGAKLCLYKINLPNNRCSRFIAERLDSPTKVRIENMLNDPRYKEIAEIKDTFEKRFYDEIREKYGLDLRPIMQVGEFNATAK